MAKSSVKFLTVAAIGLAAGIGIGMLIAPAKGSKTRRRLKQRFSEFAEMMEEGVVEKLETLKSTIDENFRVKTAPGEPEVDPARKETNK
jgi:gas vesicle protein